MKKIQKCIENTMNIVQCSINNTQDSRSITKKKKEKGNDLKICNYLTKIKRRMRLSIYYLRPHLK